MIPPRDKGAHFYKCDLQVHTPRDTNWEGAFAAAVSEDDRMSFASSLVRACRVKGINAIAITDHHDLCFYEFISVAAKSEVDGLGNPIPAQDQLNVLPGVELTLSTPPCQAILILDPDIENEMFDTILARLSITPTDSSLPVLPPVTSLDTGLGFAEIGKALDNLQINNSSRGARDRVLLAGKYIILPNVKPGGHQTALRTGFHRSFSEMQFVGGYIEKVEYEALEDGAKHILDGKIPAWSENPIGVIQTGDNRRAIHVNGSYDFPELGEWPSWIKWSQPSAEALRQAFLARKSRISHTEPTMPSQSLRAVKISNCEFLGPLELSFNPQFSAIIGGRGTGKSTIFEYVRWALFEESRVQTVNEELPNYELRRKSLIENTLKPLGGEVTVWYEKNGACYAICRGSTTNPGFARVTAPDGSVALLSEADVRREFPISGYSQKQLSSIGSLKDEVYRLLQGPVTKEISFIKEQLYELIPELKSMHRRLLRRIDIQKDIDSIANTIKSLDDQSKALRKGLNEMAPEDQAVLDVHSAFISRENWMKEVNLSLGEIQHVLRGASESILAVPDPIPPENLPNLTTLQEIASTFARIRSAAITSIADILQNSKAEVESEPVAAARALLESSGVQHNQRYKEVLALTTQSEVLQHKLGEIEAEKGVLATRASKLNLELRGIQNLETQVAEGEKNWLNLLDTRSKLLTNEAEKMTASQRRSFKATVNPCCDPRPIQEAVRKLLAFGKNIRGAEEKSIAIASFVVKDNQPIQEWHRVFDELNLLLGSSVDFNPESFPLLINSGGLSEANANALKQGIKPDQLVEFRYLDFADDVEFEFALSADAQKYIPFNQASQGQQATAMLRTLLSQKGMPLLIDQPEEDIDNEQIGSITDSICDAKSNRQILFVSHNANIVVNGDAELVVVMGYPDPDDQSHTQVVAEGSIDSPGVRDRITKIMEGGREAFELRGKKYGF